VVFKLFVLQLLLHHGSGTLSCAFFFCVLPNLECKFHA
jgi:hypothetical protein